MELFSKHLGFIKVATTASPPAMGTHINVYLTDVDDLSLWCRVAAWTLDLLPCWVDGAVFATHFDIYSDNVLKKTYSYEIRRKGLSWIPLLPFIWVNFFIPQYTDAFSATVNQFIADAMRDRVL